MLKLFIIPVAALRRQKALFSDSERRDRRAGKCVAPLQQAPPAGGDSANGASAPDGAPAACPGCLARG